MKDALRPDLDVIQAAAVLRALRQAEVYGELVVESGWSPDGYESWLSEKFQGQLLAPETTP